MSLSMWQNGAGLFYSVAVKCSCPTQPTYACVTCHIPNPTFTLQFTTAENSHAHSKLQTEHRKRCDWEVDLNVSTSWWSYTWGRAHCLDRLLLTEGVCPTCLQPGWCQIRELQLALHKTSASTQSMCLQWLTPTRPTNPGVLLRLPVTIIFSLTSLE